MTPTPIRCAFAPEGSLGLLEDEDDGLVNMETGKCGQRGTKTYNHPAAPGVQRQLGGQALALFQGTPPLPTGEAEADLATDRGGED